MIGLDFHSLNFFNWGKAQFLVNFFYMQRFRNNKDESAEFPVHVLEELERMSQIITKAMQPMQQVTEAFNRSGIFDTVADVMQTVKQHTEQMEQWKRALALPTIRRTESIILRRIERSPQSISISDEDKQEIVDTLLERLKSEMIKSIPYEIPIVDLFFEGNTICRIWKGERLRYPLSVSRKKLLFALTHEPQDREVLMDVTNSPSKNAFHQLVKGVNDQIKVKLNLAESVIVNEVGYFINSMYSIRKVNR